MKNIKLFLSILTFIALIIGVLLLSTTAPFGISFAVETTKTVQSVTVEPIDFQNSYKRESLYIGQIEAQQSAQSGFEISGMVDDIFFEEGESVKKGDILATLDIERLNARRNEAEATLLRAEADLVLAEATYQRVKGARAANAVSAQENDEAFEARESSAAAVSLAKAQLTTVLTDIEKATLISPFDGAVVRRYVDEGTVVSMGMPVLEIQQNSTYHVRVGVTPEIASSLNIGEQKTILIDDVEYQAKVSTVLPFRSQNRTVDVLLTLVSTPDFILPGDLARMPLVREVEQQGLWVPLKALKESQRGLWAVYSIDEIKPSSTAKRNVVEVIHTTDNAAFVTGALRNDIYIVTKGANKLVPGQIVNPVRGVEI